MDHQADSSFPHWPEFRRLFAYDNLLGKLLQDRYEVVRRLGAGGMGVVFLARHVHLDKFFALKIISPRFLDDPAIAERFLLEARAASKIDHPNVVSITDFGVPDEGPAFFAMEHLEGEDLARMVAREGPLPWRRALPIAQQVARALAAAHQRGVVHRDIKPQNCVRITRDDNPDFIKVLDFGLAKVLTGTGTSAWTVGGSPGYIAPEIYRGGKTDHRVDLFALGALLHTLLVGRLPAQTPDDVDLPPGAPVLHTADLPPPLQALIARATHDDPARRHPTAEAFISDLEATRAALERPPVPSTSPSPPPRPSRRPLVLAAAGALALTLAIVQLRPSAEPAAPPVPSDSSPRAAANTSSIPPAPVPSDTPSTSPAPAHSDSASTSPARADTPTNAPVPSDTPSTSPARADTPTNAPAPVPSDTSTPASPEPVPSTTSSDTPAPTPGPADKPPRPRPADGQPRRAPFDEPAARALLNRQADGLAACKAASSFRGVAARIRLDGDVRINPRGKAVVDLPPGYDVNACIERLVESLQFKASATGGRLDHVFML